MVNTRLQSSMKVWLYMSALSLALMVGGLKLADRHGLLAGFLIALVINAFVFFYADIRLQRRFASEILEGQDPYGLLSMLQRLSTKAGIPVPRLHLISVATPTSLSFGMASGHSAVLVSEGLVNELNHNELEAVLALEVARLKSSETVGGTAAAAFTSVICTVAWVFDQVLFLGFLRRNKSLRGRPFTAAVFPLIALISRMIVGRKRFFETDAYASNLIENPRLIANVLWKLSAFQKTRPFHVPVSDVSLFVVSPLSNSRWYRLFQPQPPMEHRIRRLAGHYPL